MIAYAYFRDYTFSVLMTIDVRKLKTIVTPALLVFRSLHTDIAFVSLFSSLVSSFVPYNALVEMNMPLHFRILETFII